MSTVNIYDMAQTWNNGAAEFTAIKMTVTDTASLSTSALFDLLIGSLHIFRVRKDGYVFFGSGFGASWIQGSANNFTIGNDTTVGYFGVFGNASPAGVYVRSELPFGWSNSAIGASMDLSLYRDAADTFAQRRGANAQVKRVYRTFTDDTNYERQALQSGAGYFEWAAETAGSGADDIDLRLTPAGNGRVDFRNSDNAAAGGAGTLANAPTAGDPTFWLTVKINGTALAIPAWALP